MLYSGKNNVLGREYCVVVRGAGLNEPYTNGFTKDLCMLINPNHLVLPQLGCEFELFDDYGMHRLDTGSSLLSGIELWNKGNHKWILFVNQYGIFESSDTQAKVEFVRE